MLLTVSARTDSYIQFITVLIIFVFVLLVTYWVTKWTAGYQKTKNTNANLETLDIIRLPGSNKYIQIVRVGRKYLAVAICKDTVTMLTEIPEQDLALSGTDAPQTLNFKEILGKLQQKDSSGNEDGRDE